MNDMKSLLEELDQLREENKELRNTIAELKGNILRNIKEITEARQSLQLAKMRLEELKSILGI